MKRRDFLQQTGFGLAALGVGGLVLRSDAQPTPRSPDADGAETLFGEISGGVSDDKKDLTPTVSRELGPFYRRGAPYRVKLTPPFEPGTVLVVTGRIWSYETKKPLAGAALDLWQVDNQTGDYSNGAFPGDFKNRARLVADENGAFEFETVHPVPYAPSPNFWRSPHIHFIATAAGHRRLVSEMFFKGDARQDVDQLFHPALSVAVEKKSVNGNDYEAAVFDVVLEAEK